MPRGPVGPFCEPSGPVFGVLLEAGPSMMCIMLGERSQVSLLLVLLRDLPTLILVPAFIQQNKGGNKQGLYRL